MPADTTCITLPGPWEHRLIQANGAQFHVVSAGEYSETKPLVLLVHGFPQYWWAWRHQIAQIAQAGYQVVAIDQRGIGGSDKTPKSEDGFTLAQDLTKIVRSLGARKVVVVGHGRGGALAWSAASMEPTLFSGLITISSPHPRTLQRIGAHVTLRTWKYAASTFLRSLSKRKLKDPEKLREILASWSAPGNDGASAQADLYAQALNLPMAADIAIDQLRWMYLAQQRPSGRAYLRESAHSVRLPILAIRGESDPLLPQRAWSRDGEFAIGDYQFVSIANAGHFVPEEQPERVTEAIVEFLNRIT
ncbi:alpha/beta fold hydrolase [Arcanobacterium pinnipediorum]|uniref:Alpha/beta hydrolase n=1 Tax=Arcanobacterium pinnipediorum TaxID=1503041 RepID=A0ABY5AHC1_9ACTO|nr:alpha/beta hydrolase [Arcanobacterium pinnipediorum]USR79318.1 alpha/beta hydrolase [Arcanobacterium pinnipediorum]